MTSTYAVRPARAARLTGIGLAAALACAVVATPAAAATASKKCRTAAPLAPAVTSTAYPTGGTGAPVRTPGDFTFTPPAGSTAPATYVYALNVAASTTVPATTPGTYGSTTVVAAAAGGAPTTVTITPTQIGPNVLYVYAATCGGISGTTAYSFTTAPPSTPDPWGDFTGDGHADLLRVGPAAHPGLWLYAGTDDAGHLATRPTQVGGSGTGGAGSTGTVADWTGSAVSAADLTGDGVQDILVKLGTADPQTSNVEIIPGSGAGGTFDPAQGTPVHLPAVDGSGGDQTVDQAVVTPVPGLYADAGSSMPDLYAVVGDTLYVYPGYGPTFYDPVPVGSGWAGRTIVGAVAGSEPALLSRDNATGALDLWVGDRATATPAGSSPATRLASTGFSATDLPVLAGTDLGGDGLVDVFAVSGGEEVLAYPNTGAGSLGTAVSSGTTVWPAA